MKVKIKHLLGIRDLDREEIEVIFEWARKFKEVLSKPVKKVPALRDVSILNLFFEPSTRTRISFELAAKRLGADVINFSAGGSSVEKGETLYDTVKNILAMKVDMVVVRHKQIGASHYLASKLNVPIINAGDGSREHPTQALLDAFTLIEHYKDLSKINVLIVGDIIHSRVALSDIFIIKKLGGEVGVCAPPSLIPRFMEELNVRVFYNISEAILWANVVIVLRIQKERGALSLLPSVEEYISFYQINEELLSYAYKNGKDIKIMHPGPVNRDVELSSTLMESDQSLIYEQVENGVAIRMAVLFLLALSWRHVSAENL